MQFPLIYYLSKVHSDLQKMGRAGMKQAIEYYEGYRIFLLDVLKIHKYLQVCFGIWAVFVLFGGLGF
jgi:hypothetical protein